MTNPDDWQSLLRELTVELLRDPDRRRNLERRGTLATAEETHWLGSPGASEREIDDLEERIGQSLPNTYRDFLSVTNGWKTVNFEVEELFSSQQVCWWRDGAKLFIDGWFEGIGQPTEVPDDKYYVYGPEQMTGIFRDADMYSCLQISPGIDSYILLNPNARPIEGEWEAWWFASWYPGAARYRSFYELMQDQLKSAREWQPEPTDLQFVPRPSDGPKGDEPS